MKIQAGTTISELRQSKSISQEQLAELVNTPQRHISEMETDKKQPSLTMLFRLSKALQITPEELIREIANKNEK